MQIRRLVALCYCFGILGCQSSPSFGEGTSNNVDAQPVNAAATETPAGDLNAICNEQMKKLPGEYTTSAVAEACKRAQVIPTCYSQKHTPIYHMDFDSATKDSKRVLVFSLIHGDEAESGGVTRAWMSRLTTLQSRSSWRIVPILNPDGWQAHSRTNAGGVDINRNFPSKDWNGRAQHYWEKQAHKDPRRFPGVKAGSEVETKCAMDIIDNFKPDFIISIHTPYGVLDFDGPQVAYPTVDFLPWASLGTFPGSLGRYMWVDKKTPVLTIELKDGRILQDIDRVAALQDIAGTIAIRAHKKKPYDEARQ